MGRRTDPPQPGQAVGKESADGSGAVAVEFVTHELLLSGQFLAFVTYTFGSYRLWNEKLDGRATVLVGIGVLLDCVLAVLGANSDLGNNPHGTPWGHPLFLTAVITATAGMFAYVGLLLYLLLEGWLPDSWKRGCRSFVVRGQPYIWGLWTFGVTIFVLNVRWQWF